ncbi:hypothetical protein ACHQM5_023146 [Ranunculus cassubicifolius]
MARFSCRDRHRRRLDQNIVLAVGCVIVVAMAMEITTGGVMEEGKQVNSSSNRVEPDSESMAMEVVANQDIDIDGGFSSLESMLQWSIGHSDPVKLKEAAQDTQRLAAGELEKRQLEIKEMMEHLKTPSDSQLMQAAIADLTNSSLSLEEHQRALQDLLDLVELITNANDMDKFGGLTAVIQELSNSDQEMRILSAWILGKASQNNLVVQKQILDLGALAKLMEMVRSSSVEEAIKGLYAVSALIRNNIAGQELFYTQGGELMIQGIMSGSSIDIRLKRKSASLVADLADFQLETNNKEGVFSLKNPSFLKSVVDLITSTDIDLQEKALIAIKSLLELKRTDALDFKDFCGLDKVLESMGEQLLQMRGEYEIDFLLDMESLRSEVEHVFQKKLGKVLL